ncbi:UNVERIFIED_CONTAM: hypothetical protein Slati_0956400 [Sesamum latifolium]|uniref:Transposase MuDR plant domain-containing protein n=1 Tax=Sesamum latifolium TaxID=2727402 RepID=A0AAW2XQ83_9LAMI
MQKTVLGMLKRVWGIQKSARMGSGREDEGDSLEESDGEGELSNYEDFNSDKDSDEEGGPKYPVFSVTETFDPKFDIGMLFSSKNELREAIHSHAVKTRRNIKVTKNDKRRLYAKCVEEGCDWKLHALAIGDKSTFQIRDYNDKHECGANYHVKNCNSVWIGKKYEEIFRTDPKRSVKGFRQDVIKDIRSSDGSGGSKFEKLYVCFEGLKLGFLAGCRKIIGVDGCHLKGPHRGGKWLIPAFETVFPAAENRYCVRHLHGNMNRVGFRGLAHKKDLWKAARATTVTEFEERRKEICKLDIKMGERLNDKPPYQWRIPYKHAMSALSSQMPDGEDLVDCCYHVQTYLRVYDPCIYQMNGKEKWNKTNFEPLFPPNPGRQVGRPARARRLQANKKAKCTTKGVRTRHQIQQQEQAFKPPRKAPIATPSSSAPAPTPTLAQAIATIPSSLRQPSPTPRPGVAFAHVPFAPDHSQGLLMKAKEWNLPAPLRFKVFHKDGKKFETVNSLDV